MAIYDNINLYDGNLIPYENGIRDVLPESKGDFAYLSDIISQIQDAISSSNDTLSLREIRDAGKDYISGEQSENNAVIDVLKNAFESIYPEGAPASFDEVMNLVVDSTSHIDGIYNDLPQRSDIEKFDSADLSQFQLDPSVQDKYEGHFILDLDNAENPTYVILDGGIWEINKDLIDLGGFPPEWSIKEEVSDYIKENGNDYSLLSKLEYDPNGDLVDNSLIDAREIEGFEEEAWEKIDNDLPDIAEQREESDAVEKEGDSQDQKDVGQAEVENEPREENVEKTAQEFKDAPDYNEKLIEHIKEKFPEVSDEEAYHYAAIVDAFNNVLDEYLSPEQKQEAFAEIYHRVNDLGEAQEDVVKDVFDKFDIPYKEDAPDLGISRESDFTGTDDPLERNDDIDKHKADMEFWKGQKENFVGYQRHTFSRYASMMETYHAYKAGETINGNPVRSVDILARGIEFMNSDLVGTILIEAIAAILEVFEKNDVEITYENIVETPETEAPIEEKIALEMNEGFGDKDEFGYFDNGYREDAYLREGNFYGADMSKEPFSPKGSDDKAYPEVSREYRYIDQDGNGQKITVRGLQMVERDGNFYQVNALGKVEDSLRGNGIAGLIEPGKDFGEKRLTLSESRLEQIAAYYGKTPDEMKDQIVSDAKSAFVESLEKIQEERLETLSDKITEVKQDIEDYKEKLETVLGAEDKIKGIDTDSAKEKMDKISDLKSDIETAISKAEHRLEKIESYKESIENNLKETHNHDVDTRFDLALSIEKSAAGLAPGQLGGIEEDKLNEIERLTSDIENEQKDVEQGAGDNVEQNDAVLDNEKDGVDVTEKQNDDITKEPEDITIDSENTEKTNDDPDDIEVSTPESNDIDSADADIKEKDSTNDDDSPVVADADMEESPVETKETEDEKIVNSIKEGDAIAKGDIETNAKDDSAVETQVDAQESIPQEVLSGYINGEIDNETLKANIPDNMSLKDIMKETIGGMKDDLSSLSTENIMASIMNLANTLIDHIGTTGSAVIDEFKSAWQDLGFTERTELTDGLTGETIMDRMAENLSYIEARHEDPITTIGDREVAITDSGIKDALTGDNIKGITNENANDIESRVGRDMEASIPEAVQALEVSNDTATTLDEARATDVERLGIETEIDPSEQMQLQSLQHLDRADNSNMDIDRDLLNDEINRQILEQTMQNAVSQPETNNDNIDTEPNNVDPNEAPIDNDANQDLYNDYDADDIDAEGVEALIL